MRHWLQLGTRNWRTKPARTGLALCAVALGVAVVVWVTCCYESVRQSMTEMVLDWIGRSHIIVEPIEGRWALFDETLEPEITRLPGIAQTTTRTREFVELAIDHGGDSADPTDKFVRIEATGIRPDREQDFRTYRMAGGRFLAPGDRDAIVAERLLAEAVGFGIGDLVRIRHVEPPQPIRRFTVIGLVDRRRASVNQAAMIWMRLADVQNVCNLAGKIKAVDVRVKDSSINGIRRVAKRIEALISERASSPTGAHAAGQLNVTTTEAQYKRLGAAQALLQFVMLLLSCVVLLTAFFIIVATMNMGVAERIHELGLLRCIGVTRWQLCAQVLSETVPIGALGVVVGVPFGFLLQWLTMKAAPQYIGQMVINRWGLATAIVGGLGTTLFGALMPAVRAMSVSPVEATRPLAGTRRRWVAWAAALMGAAILAAHLLARQWLAAHSTSAFGPPAVASILTLYAGFALMTPVVCVVLGSVAVRVTSTLLGLRRQLLGDEVQKAPFRSAAVCCGLMVGLSLIVGLVVWGESVKRGWEFPREFPDAMLYAYKPLPLERVRALRDTDGVAEFTVTDDFPFSLTPPSRFNPLRSLLDQFSRFLAIDPDESRDVMKLTFIEGNEHDAFARLRQGGHLLVTREFAHARSRHLGDTVVLWVGDKRAKFTVAGVIASPGLDIAISFFSASTYFQTYAVGTVVGTLDDARRIFGRSNGKLILFNFQLPHDQTAGAFSSSLGAATQPARTGKPTFALGPGPIPGDGPEERVVNTMLKRLGYPPKAFVTARVLKQQIDRSINNVTLLLSTIPLVGMIVAALGVANLMMANVASRAREIAVLRAVGTTRSQVVRMVIGEAVVLGLLGSGVGLVLGMVLGQTSNDMTASLTGYRPALAVPWALVSAGAALATLLCVLAALLPARYASRSNIMAVLSGE
ncbi:MAG: ABC transporter permease [Phycisphaerae bacterium]